MKPKLDLNQVKNRLSNYEVLDNNFYNGVRNVIFQYRKHIYTTINFDLVLANWEIGKMIDEKQQSLPRAEYGHKLIKELSLQMTKDFGKGYSERNLEQMRKFLRTFKIPQTVSAKLSWSHYTLLIGVNDNKARSFYYEEAIKKQLECKTT